MDEHAHHLEIGPGEMAGNDGLGRYVFLPGSPDRAARVARRFDDARRLDNRRGLGVHLGRLHRDGLAVDVAAVPTGMGCPSVDIIVTELVRLGARRFMRIGTAGTLQPAIGSGDLVIASAAVRDEGASDAYAPREFPAVADPLLVELLCGAARDLGLGERTYCGVVHSKDSFFGREFAEGPDAERNRAYMDLLRRDGVLASEMEAAHLFVLGAIHGTTPVPIAAGLSADVPIRCGAVMAVIGDHTGFADLDDEQAAEERLIDLAIEGFLGLARREARRSPQPPASPPAED